MKIQGPGYNDVIHTERGGAVTPAGAGSTSRPARVDGGDRVEISPGALEFERLREAAKAAPEIRAGVVSALQESIREGRYRVDDVAIAARIIEEFLGG